MDRVPPGTMGRSAVQIREIKIQVRVVVERDGDGFHAYVPDLKGVHAAGDTESEAITAVREGVTLYMQSLMKHNQSIPVGVVVFDRSHSSAFAMAWCLILEGFGLRRAKRHSSVEEITVQGLATA